MTTMLETKPAVTEEDVERTIAELESVLKNFEIVDSGWNHGANHE